MDIIAPWRTWEFKSRDDEIEYAEKNNIPLKINRETNYSKDKNLWHLSHEGLDLENPANEPKYDEILELGVSPEKAPDKDVALMSFLDKINGDEPSDIEYDSNQQCELSEDKLQGYPPPVILFGISEQSALPNQAPKIKLELYEIV